MFLMKLVITGSRTASSEAICNFFRSYRGGYGGFRTDYLMTIGADFFLLPIRLEELGIDVKLQCWRLAEQDRFAAVRSLYHRGASGLIVTFDAADINSFRRIDAMVEECWQNTGRGMVPMAIVSSNSSDIGKKMSAEQIQGMVDYYNIRTAEIDDPPNVRYFELDHQEAPVEMLNWLASKYINIVQRSGTPIHSFRRIEEISSNVKEVIEDLSLEGVTVDDEYIYVQGSRALYRISIRTKQVQAAETSAKICIVSKYSNRQQLTPLLPFVPYESHHVAEIISKVLLLLNDRELPPDIESKVREVIPAKGLFASLRG
ncbi:MAG: hypothetical protein ACFFD4_16640 [Candidatus Odinarchaeota archaeon]